MIGPRRRSGLASPARDHVLRDRHRFGFRDVRVVVRVEELRGALVQLGGVEVPLLDASVEPGVATVLLRALVLDLRRVTLLLRLVSLAVAAFAHLPEYPHSRKPAHTEATAAAAAGA